MRDYSPVNRILAMHDLPTSPHLPSTPSAPATPIYLPPAHAPIASSPATPPASRDAIIMRPHGGSLSRPASAPLSKHGRPSSPHWRAMLRF